MPLICMWELQSVINERVIMDKKWQIKIFSLIATTSVLANPTGAEVMQGGATLASDGQTLEIQAADKTILHWQDFSIKNGEMTRFIQPNSSSTVLNRVVGLNPSQIHGILEANGRVILINPSGILIGKEGIIRTAEFIASTTDILNLWDGALSDADTSLAQISSPSASLINHEGLIQATGVNLEGGKVFQIAADVHIDGKVQALGGHIELAGGNVELGPSALLDTRAFHGGGTICVGKNLQSVHIAKGAVLTADALQRGDGGRVSIWSEKSTSFEGQITARGGALEGDGGFVEISSLRHLHFHGTVDTTAVSGKIGMLLLDPSDITINAGPSIPAFTPTYNPAVAGAIVAVSDIITALGSTNVSISTSNGSGGFGDIDWLTGFPISAGMWTMPTSLSLNADRNITLDSDIICTVAGPINLTASGLINIGSGAAITSAHIATMGAINMIAGTGINLVAGINLGADAIVETTSLAAPLHVTSTTGDVTISSATGDCQAAFGSPFGGPVTFNIPAGDLNLISDNQGYVSINTQDHLEITANNLMVEALGMRPSVIVPATCHIFVNSATGTPSTVTLNTSWISNAAPSPMGDPNYIFNFQNSPLLLTTNSDLVLSNTSTFLTGSGFFSLGSGGNFVIHGNTLIQANAVAGTTIIASDLGLTMTVDGVLTLQNLLSSPAAFIANTSVADFTVNVKGDILIEGRDMPNISFFGTLGDFGNITLTSEGDITLNRGGEIFPPSRGTMTIIANKSFSMTNGCLINSFNPPGAGCELTIVVDNEFPTPPGIGPNLFGMDAMSHIFPGTQALIQIYSARQVQNQINATATINGSTFTPGPFDVNTSTEHWSTYYSGTFAGSIPYLIFYKEPVIPFVPPAPAPIVPVRIPFPGPQLAAMIGNLFDTIDEFAYPLSFFRDQFCVKWHDPKMRKFRNPLWEFNNDSCYFVQVENYRKYYPYREKHRID